MHAQVSYSFQCIVLNFFFCIKLLRITYITIFLMDWESEEWLMERELMTVILKF